MGHGIRAQRIGQQNPERRKKEMQILWTKLRIEVAESTLKGLHGRESEAHTALRLWPNASFQGRVSEEKLSKDKPRNESVSDPSSPGKERADKEISNPNASFQGRVSEKKLS